MPVQRPSFAAAWARFAEIHLSVAQVGAKIGGKVAQNVAAEPSRTPAQSG